MPPSATTSLPSTAYPGLTLGPLTGYVSGPGTHINGGRIIASLLGHPTVLPSSTSTSTPLKHTSSKPLITIPRLLPSAIYSTTPSPHVSATNVLPSVGSLVLARVIRVRTRQVDLGILCVSSTDPNPAATSPPSEQQTSRYYDGEQFHVNSDAYPATIRREDIRATEKDKVVPAEMFRVGDIVRGEIISVGDSANYYITTARNELGVLVAKSELTGEVMAPVSWKEFEEVGGAAQGRREGRKVAKPF